MLGFEIAPAWISAHPIHLCSEHHEMLLPVQQEILEGCRLRRFFKINLCLIEQIMMCIIEVVVARKKINICFYLRVCASRIECDHKCPAVR